MENRTQIQAAALRKETSALGVGGPSSVPASELLTVALGSFLEQIKEEFAFCF